MSQPPKINVEVKVTVRIPESAFYKLAKILDLEQNKGYQARSVIGGLEKYTQRWVTEAKLEAVAEQAPQIEAIANLFQGYFEQDLAGREKAVTEAQRQLTEMRDKGLWAPPQRERRSPRQAFAADGEAPAEAASLSPFPEGSGVAPGGAQPTVEVGPPPGGYRAVPFRPAVLSLDSPSNVLPGVSGIYAGRLNRLGVRTIRDLLYLFPRRYNDYSKMQKIGQVRIGEVETIVGTIQEVQNVPTRRGIMRTEATIMDETGQVRAVWFNQPYLAQSLPRGAQIVISGRTEQFLGRPVFQSPEYELLESEDLIHTGRLVPVYPLTEGVGPRWLRRLVKRTADRWVPEIVDHLPAMLRQRANLLDLPMALSQIHFPDSQDSLERARRRLAFDEFLLIQLGVLQRKQDWQDGQPGNAMRVENGLVRSFVSSLPFTLTGAQERALREILADMQKPKPMARLLQGEVGSGKTVVAAAALLVAVNNGFQAAVMAPTEILAEQHYKTITNLFTEAESKGQGRGDLAVTPKVRLLTGSLRNSDKTSLHDEIAAGNVDVVVGTHALIQGQVDFRRLGFIVIDEQHRFGVMQRATLRQKGLAGGNGTNPHVLVMTATPIPRTLALTIYGDLDISVIDELPPGRREIKTYWLTPRMQERAYAFIRKEVNAGRQAFVICPLIEESEFLETKAAVAEYERLQSEILPDLRLGLLHGRLRPHEKDMVMNAFRQGQLDVLVSTPVVEVGIDVPNATVMLIAGAERFGLAQLHQFRGRVGRGEHQSYCLLLADSPSIEGQERLQTITRTQDGFALAEEDLKMRGPGEFFGTRQSGLPDLKIAKLSDVSILEQARTEALTLFAQDRKLERPEHRLLAQKVAAFWQVKGEGDLS